jgi:hypothetical protein
MVIGHSHEPEDTAERGALVPWRLLNVQALLCSIISHNLYYGP